MVKAAFVMKGMFSNLLILLKQKSVFGKNIVIFAVTPCVGVWIEILQFSSSCCKAKVTPCVGVWIEIAFPLLPPFFLPSLPAWECGLK